MDDLKILLKHEYDSLRLKIRHARELTDDVKAVVERKRQVEEAEQAMLDFAESLTALEEEDP